MNPHNFIGDYFYQASRRESVESSKLCEKMTAMLSQLVKNRKLTKDKYPKGIFVIRDGLSEGEFTSVIF